MILLTGATGFLGARLLGTLLKHDHEVVAIKRTTSSTARIRSLLDDPRLHLVDFEGNGPTTLFQEFSIDTIIHAATEYGRGATPLYSILDANLILPLRLAELGLANGLKAFINTDSFFNKRGNSYSNLLNYSLSKKSLLIWLEKLAGDLKIVNVVLEHIYGPGDSGSKFVEATARSIAIDRVPRISLTHGHQERDFVHVDDAAAAYLALVDHARQADFTFESFELGTGVATPVRELVVLIKELSGSTTELGFGDLPYRPDEIMSSAANNGKLRRLGWEPTRNLRDGIADLLRTYEAPRAA